MLSTNQIAPFRPGFRVRNTGFKIESGFKLDCPNLSVGALVDPKARAFFLTIPGSRDRFGVSKNAHVDASMMTCISLDFVKRRIDSTSFASNPGWHPQKPLRNTKPASKLKFMGCRFISYWHSFRQLDRWMIVELMITFFVDQMVFGGVGGGGNAGLEAWH